MSSDTINNYIWTSKNKREREREREREIEIEIERERERERERGSKRKAIGNPASSISGQV